MKVAVTGGIGSGKTELCQCFAKAGKVVFSCDQIYLELLESNEEMRNKIFSKIPEAKAEDGSLDRKALARIVFADKRKREALNKITHPLIMKELLRRMDAQWLSFAEVPLLFEGGYEKHFDKIIVVLRNDQARIRAVMERSGLSYEEVKAILSSQYNYDKLPMNKYSIVHNNGTAQDLADKAIFLMSQI